MLIPVGYFSVKCAGCLMITFTWHSKSHNRRMVTTFSTHDPRIILLMSFSFALTDALGQILFTFQPSEWSFLTDLLCCVRFKTVCIYGIHFVQLITQPTQHKTTKQHSNCTSACITRTIHHQRQHKLCVSFHQIHLIYVTDSGRSLMTMINMWLKFW